MNIAYDYSVGENLMNHIMSRITICLSNINNLGSEKRIVRHVIFKGKKIQFIIFSFNSKRKTLQNF